MRGGGVTVGRGEAGDPHGARRINWGEWMKKYVAVLTVLLILAGCTPNKEQPKPDRTMIDALAVQVCVEIIFAERFPDENCDKGMEGFQWIYIVDHAQNEIPAVKEHAGLGTYTFTKPAGMGEVPRVPAEGAKFKRP